MSSSVVYSRTTSSVQSSSLRRNNIVHRIQKPYPIQVRTLWWWGRQGSWSSTNEDTFEERMQRHQKILRHRYSRALRRRSTWDRDNSPPLWSWRGSGRLMARRWGCKPLSTSDFMQARLREDETGIPTHDQPWDTHKHEFEAFKTKIDEAIKRDPYGVVFGRRLRCNSSTDEIPRNSLWNLLGFHDGQTGKTEPVKPTGSPHQIKIDNLDAAKPVKEAKPVSTHTSPKYNVTTEIKSSPGEEYVYDPISGRKVLKQIDTPVEVAQPRKPFLQALFSEHGMEEAPPVPSSEKPKTTIKSQDRSRFENSRSHEYQKLRAATLGTSIDTTVAFVPKHESKRAIVETSKRPMRETPEPDEDAPLFSGTTYEGREQFQNPSQSSVTKPDSHWLRQEGFKQIDSSTSAGQTSPVASINNRLQPSLDRVQNREQINSRFTSSKLQPAMDRMQGNKPSEASPKRPAPLNILVKQEKAASAPVEKDLESDKREDLDLLRASDVRAATKSARITRQDIEQAKTTTRSKLEADFTGRQKAAEISSDMDAAHKAVRSSRTSSSIDSVRAHMQRYPDGIVARTMKSMGIFNDNFKKYERSDKSPVDLTEKLELKQEALDKLPSIFKNTKSKPVSAMKSEATPEVEQFEKSKAEMTKAILSAKQKAVDQWQTESLQVQQLADSIREVYEAHTAAPEDEVKTSTGRDVLVQSPQPKSLANIHPLKLATVKPGVARYPVIEHHVNVFEPKLIELRTGTKASQKVIESIQTELDTIKSAKVASPPVNQNLERDQTNNMAASTVKIVNDVSAPAGEPKKEISIYASAYSRKGSKEEGANDNTSQVSAPKPAPAVEPASFISPFVILTYNKGTGEVDMTQLNTLMGSHKTSEKVNPIVVMGRLNYPAAFVPRFVELEKAGYQLISGGGDLLIFHKEKVESEVDILKTEALSHIKLIKADIKKLRDTIAQEEAQSQPQSDAKSVTLKSKTAATVLDEIPTDTPTPGPAAPTAPIGSSIVGQDKKKFNKGAKVKRQEQVFSGTIRPNHSSSPQGNSTGGKKRRGVFSRFFRTLTTVINTVVALGVITYVVGVVAEGRSAQAQYERGTAVEGDDSGPRKKVVMPATRPGIFSTESTRD